MSHISKTSTYFLYILRMLQIILPVSILLKWLFISQMDCFFQTPEGIVNLSTLPWNWKIQALGFFADSLGALSFFLSLFLLHSLFSSYRDGEIFTHTNALIYRNLGVLYLVDAFVLRTLSQTVMVLAVTLNNPVGHRYLNIGFSLDNGMSLFYGVFILAISWVMKEASYLNNEHSLTI